MARRFSAPRVPKRYVWVHTSIGSNFNDGNVAVIQLVSGADFSVGGGLGAESRTCNIKRIIGSAMIQAADAAILDNIADGFIYGPVGWGIYIQDLDNTTPNDPFAIAVSDEVSLGTGITEGIGLGIDTSAMVSGTGLGVAFAHQYPFSTTLQFDIHSNRRLSNDQELVLNFTRPNSSTLNLQPEEDFIVQVGLRTLIQLP